jgi:hypothetical protein
VIADKDWSSATEIRPVMLSAIQHVRCIAMFCAGVVGLIERGLAFHNHGAGHGGDNQVVELLRLRELLC